ncbi:hypothetical protein ACLB2K_062676 [Fragaria x ananassa]
MAMARCSSTAALIVIAFSVVCASMVSGSGQETGGRLVGGEAQWNSPGFDYRAWADGERIAFHVGDELIFQYNQGDQNVVVADSPESFD